MMEETTLTRTILYFPTIAVPNGTWLRRALLYWDEVASIVPREVNMYERELGESLIPYTPEIQYLLAEGAFKPIPPDLIVLPEALLDPAIRPSAAPENRWELLGKFEDEFRKAVTSDTFKRQLPPQPYRKLDARVHRNKMSQGISGFLFNLDLAKFGEEYEEQWYLVEQKTALLYMSMLAKYLANTMGNVTVPGTDREEYLNLSYAPLSDEPSEACLSVHLANCLPVPREDVPLSDILDFRDRREDELRYFRSHIDDLEEKLSGEAENGQELERTVRRSKETLEREINALAAQLRDARLATKLGSLKTLCTAGNAALVGWLAEAMGYGTEVPIDLGLAGLGPGAFVGVSQYWVSQRNERRTLLRESPYAYLYYGRAESIL